MNTAKIILIYLCISILLGSMNNADRFDEFIGNWTGRQEVKTNEFVDYDNTWTDNKNNVVTQALDSLGNIMKLGKVLFDVVIDAVNPISTLNNDSDNPIINIFDITISVFRIIFSLLVVILIYQVFKNKKTD